MEVVYVVSWPKIVGAGPFGHVKGLDTPCLDKLSANGSDSSLCLNLMMKLMQDKLRYVLGAFSIPLLLAYTKQSGFKWNGNLLCGA